MICTDVAACLLCVRLFIEVESWSATSQMYSLQRTGSTRELFEYEVVLLRVNTSLTVLTDTNRRDAAQHAAYQPLFVSPDIAGLKGRFSAVLLLLSLLRASMLSVII